MRDGRGDDPDLRERPVDHVQGLWRRDECEEKDLRFGNVVIDQNSNRH